MKGILRNAVGLLMLMSAAAARADAQALETETARTLRRGTFEFGHNFEYQTSSEGSELALPFAIEVGLTNRLELLMEPVAYTAIRSHLGPRATGPGDLEVTLTYLAARETAHWPALAMAGEVKFPTARNTLIGTGRTDYALYLIGSRRMGRLDIHANVAYTFVGRPAGVTLRNTFGGALAAELPIGHGSELFAEALAVTGAQPGTESAAAAIGPQPIAPEIGGAEVVGTVGVARWVTSSMKLSGSVSYDNNGAVLFRPGFEFRFHP